MTNAQHPLSLLRQLADARVVERERQRVPYQRELVEGEVRGLRIDRSIVGAEMRKLVEAHPHLIITVYADDKGARRMAQIIAGVLKK